jgi:hypothetical protein
MRWMMRKLTGRGPVDSNTETALWAGRMMPIASFVERYLVWAALPPFTFSGRIPVYDSRCSHDVHRPYLGL